MVHDVPVAIDEIPLEELRRRRSVKWRTYGDDIIPAWVAEMDFTLAEPIAAALHAAIDRSDTGYRWADEVPEALADFTARMWGWQFSSDRVLVLADVMTGIAQSLIRLTDPGDHVVINPPVYPPFFSTVRDVANRTVREVPVDIVRERVCRGVPMFLFPGQCGREDTRQISAQLRGMFVERMWFTCAQRIKRSQDGQPLHVNRMLPAEQLVADYSQCVHVRSDINVLGVALQLLTTHVRQRPQ